MRGGTWQFDPSLVVVEMDAIMAWLRANDITAEDVPTNATVTFQGEQMTVEVFLNRGDGRRYIDSTTGEPARSTVTVPIVEPPPPLRSLILDLDVTSLGQARRQLLRHRMDGTVENVQGEPLGAPTEAM